MPSIPASTCRRLGALPTLDPRGLCLSVFVIVVVLGALEQVLRKPLGRDGGAGRRTPRPPLVQLHQQPFVLLRSVVDNLAGNTVGALLGVCCRNPSWLAESR